MEIEILENTQEFLDEVYGRHNNNPVVSLDSNVRHEVNNSEDKTFWFVLPSSSLNPLDTLFAKEPIGQFLHHTSDLWDFVGIMEVGK